MPGHRLRWATVLIPEVGTPQDVQPKVANQMFDLLSLCQLAFPWRELADQAIDHGLQLMVPFADRTVPTEPPSLRP